MSRTGVEQLIYLYDRAFAPIDEDVEHSFLLNLDGVRDEDWQSAAPTGGRTILQIAWHVAACKFMYANQGFEDGMLTWDELFNHWDSSPSKSEMIDWLREAHAYFRRVIEPLGDADLMVERKAPWGAMHETRWLIANLTEHDAYHAGEINLIRALLQGTDAWPKY